MNATATFYHASGGALAAGTMLRASFRLLELERELFEAVVTGAAQPDRLARVMLRHMRGVVNQPQLKGQYDSTVIEGIVEHVRQVEFPDRISRR